MLFNNFRKRGWLILKWQITLSKTRYIKNFALRRAVNALLVPLYFLRYIGLILSKEFYFPQISLPITRRCVFNCENCAALYPIFRMRKEGDIPIEELIAVVDRFLACVDGVNNICVSGGEPFLHPSLSVLLNKLIASPKIFSIRTATTGFPVPQDDTLKVLAHEKVMVTISDYGELSKKLDLTKKKLKEYGVNFRIETNDWSDFGNFEYRNHTERELRRLFSRCWQRECMIIISGRLHYCFRSGHGTDLELFPRNPNDYVDLMSGTPEEVRVRLKKFLELEYTSACNYCDGAGIPCSSRATQVNSAESRPA